MIYTVQFEDDEAFASMRSAFMAEHLSFLEANADTIQAAGPLQDSMTGDAAGGLWLVVASHSDEVYELVKKDPFWPTGLRKSVKVLTWHQVFADGKRR